MIKTDLKNILFTRSLNDEHHAFGKNLGLQLTDKAFIEVELNHISEDQINLINSKIEATWIFTSQNAVRSIGKVLHRLANIEEKKCFAVGQKTAQELAKMGIRALIPEHHNSQALIDLLDNNKAGSFIYFTGNLRQSTIINFFEENEIDFEEIETYQTKLIQPELEIENFNGVCFCSPSAVVSFFKKYKLEESVPCFAIGNTTAVKLLDYSGHVVMAEKTNVFSLLEICHNYLNS